MRIQEGISLSPPAVSSVFHRALGTLRAPCRALITPRAVVLEVGGGHQPVLLRCGSSAASLPDSLALAVADLLRLVDQTQVRRRRVRVAVSDYWARPLVMKLPGQATSDDTIERLLATQYRKIYGDLMQGWRWCWSQHDTRLVAVAWPALALDALQNGLASRACVLCSAKPSSSLLGAQPGPLAGASWLAILQHAHLTLMRLQGGALEDWCVVPGLADAQRLATQLPLQLARAAARCADPGRALVMIDFDAATDLSPVRQSLLAAGWQLRVCAPAEFSGSWVWRLQQRISLPLAA